MSFEIKIDLDACSGCGTCYEVCPSDAVKVFGHSTPKSRFNEGLEEV